VPQSQTITGYIDTAVTISLDGSLYVSGGKYGTIMLWGLDESKHLYSPNSNDGSIPLYSPPTSSIFKVPGDYKAIGAMANILERISRDSSTRRNTTTLLQERQPRNGASVWR
jgi:hypothetical protein